MGMSSFFRFILLRNASDLEPLNEVAALLTEAAVPYMITGSVASSHYGAPRSTQDIDIVVAFDSQSLGRFLAKLSEDEFYVSPEAARDALIRASMFNVVHFRTAWKIDLIMRKSRPFSQMEFSRRIFADLAGNQLWIASPEDVILSKLEWSAMSHSDRQIDDAARVLAVQKQYLDRTYLETWAEKLNVSRALGSLLQGS